MAADGHRAARAGVSSESIEAHMARRRREQANAGPRAKAAAHEAYRAAIRTGRDLRLAQPSDVTAFGARLLDGGRPKPGPQIVRAAPRQDGGNRNRPAPVRRNPAPPLGKPVPADAARAVREGVMQADAAVRGAANLLTFGGADHVAAAMDAWFSPTGHVDWMSRYQTELAREKARDRYDGAHRAAAQAAGHVGGAVLGVGAIGPMEGALAAAPRLADAATLTSREIASMLAAGGGVGLGAQGLADVLDRGRRRSTLGDYVGAAGGGVAGVAALPFGPARAGAVDGAVTSILQDVLKGRPVSLHDAGQSAVLGNLLGGAAGIAGRAASNALGKTAKGKLGEALGWVRSVADGKPRELGPKRMDPLTDDKKLVRKKGGHWYPDGWRGEKRFEDKFGTKAEPSPNQRLARARLGPNFQLNHWLPADIGKIAGVPAAASAPQIARDHHRR